MDGRRGQAEESTLDDMQTMKSTYRVEAKTGWLSEVPWPFGLLDVSDDELWVHSSWLYAWYMRNTWHSRKAITAIRYLIPTSTGGTSAMIFVDANDRRTAMTIRIPTGGDVLLEDLRSRGYPMVEHLLES